MSDQQPQEIDRPECPSDLAGFDTQPEQEKPAGSAAVKALRIVAWTNLVVCTLGSLYVFRELGVRLIPEEGFLDYTEKIVSPFGIALSLAIFFQGIFGCVFFLVIASIAENIMAIRRRTENFWQRNSRDGIK